MALMMPDLAVEAVEREHGSNAEARIYAAIRDRLGPEFTVLYSVAWLEKHRAAAPQEVEIRRGLAACSRLLDFYKQHADRIGV